MVADDPFELYMPITGFICKIVCAVAMLCWATLIFLVWFYHTHWMQDHTLLFRIYAARSQGLDFEKIVAEANEKK